MIGRIARWALAHRYVVLGVTLLLVAAGVRSIVNFAPQALTVPAGVDVRQVDLSVELQVLAFLDQQKGVQLVPDTVPTDLTAVGVAR